MTVARSEQQTARVVSTTNAKARAEQIAVRVISSNRLYAIAEQVTVRVVSTNVPDDGGSARPVVFVVT